MADLLVRKAFRMFKVSTAMLKDRGYHVGHDNDEMQKKYEYFKEQFSQKGNIRSSLTIKGTSNQGNILVFFSDETKKPGVKPIRDLSEVMSQDPHCNRAILVTQQPLTPMAKQAIIAAAPRHIIESFVDSELLINVTKHELVPLHEPLNADQKRELLERYKIKDSSLPRMLATDPITRYFGMKRGDVVKIVRESETAGRYTTYRLVQ